MLQSGDNLTWTGLAALVAKYVSELSQLISTGLPGEHLEPFCKPALVDTYMYLAKGKGIEVNWLMRAMNVASRNRLVIML